MAVRGQPTKDLSFSIMAEQASMAMLEAQAHSHLPFAEVVKVCGVKRVPGVNPIFQVRNLGAASLMSAQNRGTC